MGFKVLLNNSIKINKKESSISLIGVENWGSGKFKKNGDLDLALKDVDPADFKILMSHDPSHWEKQVITHKEHIDLTLSGHTHGMQFGIEIPGWIKWSPIQYRYKYWAGVYKEQNQFINVNRGFGFLAYPGRVGIYPEISILDLKSKFDERAQKS
jgi:predicted MPP superfamily phosphohydrolase